MAMILESATLSRSADAETSIVVSMPSTRPDDDLYVFIGGLVGFNNSWTNVPSNWTEIVYEIQGGVSVSTTAYFWRGDSEPATYSLTQDNNEAWGLVYRISGASLNFPIHSFAVETKIDTNVESLSVTTTVNNCLILATTSVDNPRVNDTPDIQDAQGATSDVSDNVNQVGYGAYHFTQVAKGATPVEAFTHAGNAYLVLLTLAIAPETAVPIAERGFTFFGI